MMATTSRAAAAAGATDPSCAGAAADAICPRADVDAAYLRGWVARQAMRYDDLLATIAVARRASRRSS